MACCATLLRGRRCPGSPYVPRCCWRSGVARTWYRARSRRRRRQHDRRRLRAVRRGHVPRRDRGVRRPRQQLRRRDRRGRRARAWYADADGDGFGDDATATVACTPTAGAVDRGGDCDDTDATVHPGATESCTDPIDLNCDGVGRRRGQRRRRVRRVPGLRRQRHERVPRRRGDLQRGRRRLQWRRSTTTRPTPTTFYVDLDGDGHGSDRLTIDACDGPDRVRGVRATTATICTRTATPARAEDCDGLDNDCDGTIDDGASGTVALVRGRRPRRLRRSRRR